MTYNDGVARVKGLEEVTSGEIVKVGKGKGMVINIEETVSVVMFDSTDCKEQQEVYRTGKELKVKGRREYILDACGKGIRKKESWMKKYTKKEKRKKTKGKEEERKVEERAPGITEREKVRKPLRTGWKSIDTGIPIGRGQRELIIGDRQTGKTTIAVEAIITNGKRTGLMREKKEIYTVYVGVGQKRSTVARLIEIIERYKSIRKTKVIIATAAEEATRQYIAPFTGCAITEIEMKRGKDTMIVYDDLSKQAVAYRQMALLLRRPPGREAYPGDVFYLHSRLLERAAAISKGGTQTALPIVETQEGDGTAYIPTNVISITDGQIYLDTTMFNKGIRPSIHYGLSVSRVGSAAQRPIIKKITGTMKLDLAQYREITKMSQYGEDKSTRTLLKRGERITEWVRQKQLEYSTDEGISISIWMTLNTEIGVRNIKYIEKMYINKLNTGRIRNMKKKLIGKIRKIKKILEYKLERRIRGYNIKI